MFTIVDEKVIKVTQEKGIEKIIVANCDTESDLEDLGTDYYPNSVAFVASPCCTKVLSASKQWITKG